MMRTQVPDVYISVIVTLIPAIITVALRFYPARIKKVSLGWDDYLAVFALIAAFGYDACTFYQVAKGLGRHLNDLPSGVSVEEALYYQLLGSEIQEHTYTVAIGAAQLSLLALYWRLFSSSSQSGRISIIVIGSFVVSWVIARLLVATFQCWPPAYLWDKTIVGGECTVNPSDFFLSTVTAHLIIDVLLMLVPIRQISRLTLPLMQKAAILVMFMFGTTILVASIMTAISSVRYDSDLADTMWNCTPVVNWSAIEIHLSIMTCCLPLLRPVMRDVGGWFGANFSSRRDESNQVTSFRLQAANDAENQINDSDSMRGFARAHSKPDMNDTYRAWADTETHIVSDGISNTGPKTGARDIWVQYDTDLSVSHREGPMNEEEI